MTTRTVRFAVEATVGKIHSLVMLPNRPIGIYNASSSPYVKDIMVTDGKVIIYAEVGEGKDERKNVVRNFVILGATEPPQGATYTSSVNVDEDGFSWLRKVYELSYEGAVYHMYDDVEAEPEPRYTVTVTGYRTDLVVVDDVEMSREEMVDLTSLICELDKTNLNLVLQILDETNQVAVASKRENCTRYFVKVAKLNAQK